MNNLHKIFFIIILQTSCTSNSLFHIIKKQKKLSLLPKKREGQFCPQKIKSISIIGKHKKDILHFEKFRKLSPKHYRPIEIFSLLALTHMNFFPHQVTPFSKLQIMANLNGNFQTFEFPLPPHLQKKSSQKAPPHFLYGLGLLLKQFKSKKSLRSLASDLDRYLPKNIPINKDLSRFLKKNRNALLQHQIFTRLYFKADTLLRPGETFQGIHFKKLLSQLSLGQPHKIAPGHLFPITQAPDDRRGPLPLTIQCNTDLNLYKYEVYPISKNSNPIAFGVSFPDGSFILAVAGQKIEKISPLFKNALFKGHPATNKTVFCHLKKNSKGADNIYLMSSRGRDPGQYIFAGLGLKDISHKKALADFIEKYRQLRLVNPHRVLYESNRGTDEILNNLLLQKRPVFHVEKLGNIWAYGQFKKEQSFISDSRNKSFLLCQ